MREPTTTNEAYVRLLTDAFKQCDVGQPVTYEQLSAAIGRNVLDQNYRFLVQRARDRANQEVGAVFINVRNVGYHRIENNESFSLGLSARRKGRRLHRKAARYIGNAVSKTNDMSSDAVRRAYAEITHLGLLARLGQNRYTPKLEEGMKPPKFSDVVHSTVDALKVALRRTR